jgi:hypothetical protein
VRGSLVASSKSFRTLSPPKLAHPHVSSNAKYGHLDAECGHFVALQPFKEARSQALETVVNVCSLGVIVVSIILLIEAASGVRSPNTGFAMAMTGFNLVPQVAGFGNL